MLAEEISCFILVNYKLNKLLEIYLAVCSFGDCFHGYHKILKHSDWASVPGDGMAGSLYRWDHCTATGPFGRGGICIYAYYLLAPLHK